MSMFAAILMSNLFYNSYKSLINSVLDNLRHFLYREISACHK
jgi:hypothetical protein